MVDQLPDFYVNGYQMGKFDVDGHRTVARVVMDGTIFGGQYEASVAIAERFPAYSVWQPDYWNCGVRLDLEDDLSLQLCFNGGNLRYTYWKKILSKKLHTLLGTIFLFKLDDLVTQEVMWIKTFLKYYEKFWDDGQHYEPEQEQRFQFTFPCIFVISHPMSPEALIKLREILGIPDSIPLFSCDVHDPYSVRDLLVQFLEYVIE